jgi:voltage-gated potassium channel
VVVTVPEEWGRILRWGNRHRLLLERLGLLWLLTLVVGCAGAIGIYFLERNAPGTEITSYFDAFYFTMVQLLTVSSSLKNPLTTGGRVLNLVFEFWGVLFVAGSAGALVTFFLRGETD